MADRRHTELAGFIKPFRVKPGATVRLGRDFDPGDQAGMQKKHGADALPARVKMLAELQARLAAQATHGVLVVIQGMDASGKDGTIRHVFSGVNPQGVTVHSFKEPSAQELSHDFLWRCQQRLPGRGEIGVFNRSHYEEVLAVRVHPADLDAEKLPPQARGKDLWQRRYREINDWERHLVDNGIALVKLCLNLSKEEQRLRLLRRCELPHHNWKFAIADVQERAYWDEYQTALSEMLSHTSTPWAPWHVIPADRKWFARLAAGSVIVEALMQIDPRFPTLDAKGRARLATAKAALEAQAPEAAAPSAA
jgi:PPK2 family polyphosphate:nucleotide phosphotransferase